VIVVILPQDGVPETATAEFEALVTQRPNIWNDPDRAVAEMLPNHLPRAMFWAAGEGPAARTMWGGGRTAFVKLNQIREAHDRP